MKESRLLLFLFVLCQYSYGQINSNRVSRSIEIAQDTLFLEKVAISAVDFIVLDSVGEVIPSSKYYFNPQKSQLYFYQKTTEKVTVTYFKYPEFLTKTYSPFDKKLIIPKATPSAKTYSLKKTFSKRDFFGGVDTYGNITRGITVGNNQGSVLNSGLDLQITGDLSETLKIRASINDSNIPLQENGVSQNLREFDRVFIELFTDVWSLKAGDVDLQNNDSYFLNFSKKINGAKLDVVLDNDDQLTKITASGAVVRGKFTTQILSPQEGNQGPYQLFGANGELNIVVISGSETIYVNGETLKRGEQNDYVIDYNTSEITFNPTYPVNASQRIYVDFQYSDQNYNRFVTHNGVTFQNKKLSIGTYFYHEADVKNQSLQQDLTDAQKIILQQAGNDSDLMFAESAELAAYDENRIQYIKNDEGRFVYSSDENETLYNLSFSLVTHGDYDLDQATATGNIYSYVGEGLGNYSPIVQLIAPTKTQIAIVKADYQINQKSSLSTELAYSDNDLNLFSSLGDKKNQGIATTVTWQQQISTGTWQTQNQFNFDYVHENFNNLEGLYNVEFNRDWNLDVNATPNFLGSQTFVKNRFSTEKQNTQKLSLETEYLNLGNSFKGFKNNVTTYNQFRDLNIETQTSYLTSENSLKKGTFVRNQSSVKYALKNAWLQGLFGYENNQQQNTETQVLDSLTNQKYIASGIELGVGDSTKVYSKFKMEWTQTDSVQNNRLTKFQTAQNYSIESQWIKNKNTTLTTFANFRKVNHEFTDEETVLNARGQYSQRLFRNKLVLNTLYETSSGTTAQQNYNYIETEVGQGYYTYFDYNNDGIKDFEEFEVAQFTDEANYLRVLLPNVSRIPTQKAKLSQSISVNFNSFKNHESKWLRFLSHFSNQSSVFINKDQIKNGNTYNLNPFDSDNEEVVSLQQNINSGLFFNRGLQYFSTSYTFQDNQSTQSIISNTQTTKIKSHALSFQHNIEGSWVLAATAISEDYLSMSSFESRNFQIASQEISPSVSYLKNESSNIEMVYTYQQKENLQGEETLIGHNLGVNYNYNHPKKGSVLATINMIENDYEGELNSSASYRVLEGLQPDRNYTWSLLVQRKLTQLLDLSLSYNGRKSTSTNIIHIGSVQLRANF